MQDSHVERTRIIDRIGRSIVFMTLVVSVGLLIGLSVLTSDQPRRFMPLIISEDQSVADREEAIGHWRATVIPERLELILSHPFDTMYELDANLTRKYPIETQEPFKERLLMMNIESETLVRKYWATVAYIRSSIALV